jgi:copper homeostasis protein
VGHDLSVMAHVVLEVVCASVEEAAASGGADRIELCAALPTGGVTPTIGMIEETRAVSPLPIVAMVRPREGGPCPPEPDFRAALRDVAHCVRAGADEIVCGVLAPDGRVDSDRNLALVEATACSTWLPTWMWPWRR